MHVFRLSRQSVELQYVALVGQSDEVVVHASDLDKPRLFTPFFIVQTGISEVGKSVRNGRQMDRVDSDQLPWVAWDDVGMFARRNCSRFRNVGIQLTEQHIRVFKDRSTTRPVYEDVTGLR